MQTPVVMMVFNRPEPTLRVFERVRAARPPRLLVVCDGPRPDRPADAGRVAEVRRIFDTAVDWPCEVIRDFSEQNLGCMQRIRSGLDHAFQLFEEAVIVEDDCLPDSSFFPFCDEMLARYRSNPRIMHVAGTNFTAGRHRPSASYWFSHHPWMWGWATWRRAWQYYDFHYAAWDSHQRELSDSFASAWDRQYWISTFDQARRNFEATNTWDFQWNFSCRIHGGLSVVPENNLVENLGFGADSSHTFGDMTRLCIPVRPLQFPLRHPRAVRECRYADDLLTRIYAGAPLGPLDNLRARLRVFADRFRQKP